jgi:predicted nucleic acid-binding protein
MRVAVDTSFLVDIDNDMDSAWMALAELSEKAEMVLPSICLQEFLRGVPRKLMEGHSIKVRSAFVIINHDEESAIEGAKIYRQMRREGSIPEVADGLIIGTLITNEVDTILTRDKKGFAGVEGLEVITY